jgi:hypothetical protein
MHRIQLKKRKKIQTSLSFFLQRASLSRKTPAALSGPMPSTGSNPSLTKFGALPRLL